MEKLKTARRQMARIPVMYEQLMRMHPDGMPSIGMVAKYDRIGGRGSGGASLTETTAMRNLAITDAQKEMLDWLDAVYAVYFGLNDPEGKNAIRVQHDRKLAVILKMRVFEGANYDAIRDLHFRSQTSVQYVRKLYGDVVELVAREAERRGLYRTTEGA